MACQYFSTKREIENLIVYVVGEIFHHEVFYFTTRENFDSCSVKNWQRSMAMSSSSKFEFRLAIRQTRWKGKKK